MDVGITMLQCRLRHTYFCTSWPLNVTTIWSKVHQLVIHSRIHLYVSEEQK